MIGRRQIERRDEVLKIIDQRLDAVGLPDLFGQSESTLVIAEDAKAFRQIGNNAIPAVEGAANLVQENHRRATFALDSVMKADAVRLDERQWLSPSVSQDLQCIAPRSAAGQRHRKRERPGTHLSLVSQRPMNGLPQACPSNLERNTFQTKGELA